MSTAKIFLRPPPNVEFVQGYPGIPPGAPDRPQAAVKGAIEVRLGPQGAKAKYVRIELRKIETLPGGQPNSFYDFVGQSPINLWQSSEEYSLLQTQDIPFFIRLPESIPPSLSLEKGAGVKYELVGHVCIQGKTSFLRRSKPIVISTTTPLVIDKHEFHSTWPVYQQPESRHLQHDAVSLTVDRSQNCYGPGDRVSVYATIRSDSLHTVILRGFEFTLKETTIFRSGPHSSSKKSAPQVKINIIGEQKVPVNATLYGGTSHRAELSTHIPDSHTTTTLNTARHIDITYVLIVKALMGTGKPLIMELPVIVSNWPRNVSSEAVRRIGVVPLFSLQKPPTAPTSVAALSGRTAVGTGNFSTFSGRDNSFDYGSSVSPYARPTQSSTLPASLSGSSHGHADEFGVTTSGTSAPRVPASAPHQRQGFNAVETTRRPESEAVPAPGRRRSSAAGQGGQRFAIANAQDGEIPEEEETYGQSSTLERVQPASPARNAWPTAEEEKSRLYQQAKADVARVQGVSEEREPSLHSTHQRPSTANSAPQPDPRWPTAEEEKVRLFNQAQSSARITQGLASAPGNVNQFSHARGNSKDSSRSQQAGRSAPNGHPPVVSAGAALYSSAMSSIHKPPTSAPVEWSPTRPAMHSPQPQAANARLPTAEEEKEMLRRYHEATNAVHQHQKANFGASDSSAGMSTGYDAPPPPDLHQGPPPPVDDAPPPWVPNEFAQDGLSEKERYRRAFEARDAAAARAAGSPPPPPVDYDAGPPPSVGHDIPNGYGSPVSPPPQASVDGGSPPPWHFTPPPTIPPHLRARTQPMPPVTSSPQRPLTAAEEKAMLRARFDTEQGQSQGSPPPPPPPKPTTNGRGSASPPPFGSSMSSESAAPGPETPPPLMPRPPPDYIKQTREEDARLAALALEEEEAARRGLGVGRFGLPGAEFGEDDTFGLKLRPSSPFSVGLEGIGRSGTPRVGVNGVNGRTVPPSRLAAVDNA